MKRYSIIKSNRVIALMAGIALTFAGCKDEPELATITTADVTQISLTSAVSGGEITADGGAEIIARGVCYSTTAQPEISSKHTSNGSGQGVFTSNISGLTASTTYYARAFATNEAGTAYGNEVTFTTTTPSAPTVATLAITAITSSSAVSGGNITTDGGSPVTARGVCWSTTANPTTAGSKTTNGTGAGNFASDITGLQAGTTYHVRAYATNSLGTSYGDDLTFTTSAVLATVTTTTATSITRTTAVSGGNVTNSGGGTITARGVCWGTITGPLVTGSHTSDGTGTGSFTSNITGLTANTTYYYRAYATSSAGTAYGAENHFVTSPVTAPSVTTSQMSSVALTTAVAGGNVTSDNGATVTERGVCWNTSGNPTTSDPKLSNGTGTGTYTVNLTGLVPGTIYYLRAYAINSSGTGYGTQVQFLTLIADIDGNSYRTVLIGSQLWTAENLRTETYRDGSAIPNVTDAVAWSALATDAYCYFNNDEAAYKNTYGGLYNWFAVNKGTLCPTGWHVPSDQEYKTMEMALGMTQQQADSYSIVARGTDQGTQIKSTSGWYNGGNGTNSSGFNGLPGGYIYGQDGGFYDFGKLSYWWTSTEYEYDSARGTYRRADYGVTGILREGTSKKGGKYIRCVKN